MACATPVIGSAVGGIRSTVRDGVSGYLVPPRKAAALADGLAELAANPALREAMGQAGRELAYRHYTWARVTSQIAAVYERAIQSQPPRNRTSLDLEATGASS